MPLPHPNRAAQMVKFAETLAGVDDGHTSGHLMCDEFVNLMVRFHEPHDNEEIWATERQHWEDVRCVLDWQT